MCVSLLARSGDRLLERKRHLSASLPWLGPKSFPDEAGPQADCGLGSPHSSYLPLSQVPILADEVIWPEVWWTPGC